MTDIPSGPSTTATVTVGTTTNGTLDFAGDHDWYKITLSAGQAITVTINGVTLVDPYLYIRDSSGNLLYSDDDISPGVNRDSQLSFTASYSGTYFIDVGAFQDNYTGDYQVVVNAYSPPPVATNDQIADQLVNGFWNWQGDTAHHFDVTQGGTITVNISTLNPAEQALARAALAEWSDIIGVHFQEVTSGGQIVFDHNEDPQQPGPIAATDGIWSGGIISSAHVQISTSWVNTYGTSLDSYSFQTYIHEIGHALGLGHAGDYNGTASYPDDALFQNDAWSTSIMSYFSQHDNTYFAGQGFSEDYAVTPMVADIIAMQQLYGLSTTTRTGDTTYGCNSNAGGIYNASLYPDVAYTIFDNGGTDTLDFSGSNFNQLLNLNPETFSNVNGNIGNVTIARGVVIENAIGGGGNDTVVGNAANNVLSGGAGNDTVSYETAAAGVTVNLGLTTAQNTGAGIDTLTGFESLIGSAFADVLTGGATTMTLTGGGGNDLIQAGAANAPGGLAMYGGDGDDVFVLGAAADWVDGGAGFDTVDCSSATAGVLIVTSGHVGAEVDTLLNIEKIIGSNYADDLWAWNAGDVIIGGAGDDTLTSPNGSAELAGGTGNDTYAVWTATDHISENAGEGVDLVVAHANFTLASNVENLTLYEKIGVDPYAGYPGNEENWNATGNELANVIAGNAGINVLSGLGGADRLTGGSGTDTFRDTSAGLNGDTITDLTDGEKIVISDATLAGFSFSLSGNTLSWNGGSLTLTALAPGHFIASAAAGGGVELRFEKHDPANDFNGDGRSDVLLRHDSGLLTDWLGQGNATFASNQSIAAYRLDLAWHVIGTGDFNGDGRDDVLLRHDNGLMTDWLGQSNGSFASNQGIAAYRLDLSWHVVGTGDINGDGRDDLVLRHDTGLLTEWLGQSNGTFASNQAVATYRLDPAWEVIGTGDFNGDGKADILLRQSNGIMTDWLGQANGGFASNQAIATYRLDPSWHVVGTGDFNGDGRDDLLLRNDSGLMTDWLGQSNGTFASNQGVAAYRLDPSWHVIDTGDFNGDGRDDVLLRNEDGLMTDWLGLPNGTFASNQSIAAYKLDLAWHDQPVHTEWLI